MNIISTDEVVRIAQLARLGLSDKEPGDMAEQLEKVLQHFTAVQAIDTKKATTFDNAAGKVNVSREDKAIPQDLCTPKALLELAPDVHQQHVKVPAVF